MREVCGRPGMARFFTKSLELDQLFEALQESCAFEMHRADLSSGFLRPYAASGQLRLFGRLVFPSSTKTFPRMSLRPESACRAVPNRSSSYQDRRGFIHHNPYIRCLK
jgi:hypothetical protein